jgi:hypothetical protein
MQKLTDFHIPQKFESLLCHNARKKNATAQVAFSFGIRAPFRIFIAETARFTASSFASPGVLCALGGLVFIPS